MEDMCFLLFLLPVGSLWGASRDDSIFLSIAELGHCKGEDKGKEIRAFESQPEVIPFCL